MSKQLVRNQDLASDIPRRNLLTNGGVDTWQRGNGPFTAQAVNTADRWIISFGASSTMSVSRDTTNYDGNSLAAAAIVYTHVNASNLYQPFSNSDILPYQMRTKPVTFLVRVRASVANGVRAFLDGGAGGLRIYSQYHTGDGTWQTLVVTTPSGTGNPLQVGLNLEASGTYYMDNATLVQGVVGMESVPLHPAEEIARCLRYYEILSANIDGVTTAVSQSLTNTIYYKAQKALTPTVTKVGTWSVTNCGQPSAGPRSTDPTGSAYFNTVSSAAGQIGTYPSASSQYITAEANP